MKTYLFRFKILALFLFISIAFLSCNEEDEEEKLFLETHAGSVWKFGKAEDILQVYAQINNTENNPFEIWLFDAARGCYQYERITDDGSPEIVENRENKVQIRIGGDSDEYAMLTLTISGNILRVELTYFEEGEVVDEDKFILERTSDRIADLTICEN